MWRKIKKKDKEDKEDVIWLLEKLKFATVGIDETSNPEDNLHEILTTFLNMRQGDTEPDDDYLRRFRANSKTLDMAAGENFLCSMKLSGQSTLTIKEKQEQKNAATYIILIVFVIR